MLKLTRFFLLFSSISLINIQLHASWKDFASNKYVLGATLGASLAATYYFKTQFDSAKIKAAQHDKEYQENNQRARTGFRELSAVIVGRQDINPKIWTDENNDFKALNWQMKDKEDFKSDLESYQEYLRACFRSNSNTHQERLNNLTRISNNLKSQLDRLASSTFGISKSQEHAQRANKFRYATGACALLATGTGIYWFLK